MKKTQLKKKIEIMHSELFIWEQYVLIQEFENAWDDNDQYMQFFHLNIFLKTTKILKTEYNCIYVFRLILTESDYVSNNEEQIWAWISCYKQINSWTFTYWLVYKESEIETAIVNCQ